MKLAKTELSDGHVRVRFVDNAETPKAWIDICLPAESLMNPWDGAKSLGEIEARYVGVVRLATLRAAREIIGEEIDRLSNRTDIRR